MAAIVRLQLDFEGYPGDVLDSLAEIGYVVSEGLAAQEGLELSDVCNDCRAAEHEYDPNDDGPEDPYEVGGFYPVFLDENSTRIEVVQYDGNGQFLLAGVGGSVDAENLAGIGDKLEF